MTIRWRSDLMKPSLSFRNPASLSVGWPGVCVCRQVTRGWKLVRLLLPGDKAVVSVPLSLLRSHALCLAVCLSICLEVSVCVWSSHLFLLLVCLSVPHLTSLSVPRDLSLMLSHLLLYVSHLFVLYIRYLLTFYVFFYFLFLGAIRLSW